MNILSWFASLLSQIPHNSFPTNNQGVLDGQRDTDFVAGTIPFEVKNAWYADIPADVIAKGKEQFPFSIAYEWITPDKNTLVHHLQHAPIQITIPGTNPIHAVVLVAIVGDVYYYFDSYSPFIKSMST